MAQLHKVECDRCGKVEEMRTWTGLSLHFDVPERWGESDKYKDLCPRCFKEYKKHQVSFK